jgi:hypothetical protein
MGSQGTILNRPCKNRSAADLDEVKTACFSKWLGSRACELRNRSSYSTNRDGLTNTVNSRLPILLLVAMVLSSCSTLVSDEFPDFPQEPVLNSIIVAGRPLEAHLSFAEKIDSTHLQGNGDAAVYFRSGEAGMRAMTGNDSGLYFSDYIPGAGEIVELNATVHGFEELSAADTVPVAVPVTITDHTNRARYSDDGYFMAGITIRFSDDPQTDDFYELLISRRDSRRTRNLRAFNDRLDILLNEGIDPYSTGSLLFSDALFEGDIVEMSLDFSPGSSSRRCFGDSCYEFFVAHTLIAELRHVSEAYYRYKKQFYIYEKTREVEFIDGTAVPISNYSNVHNGRGIVAAYASVIDSVQVPRDSMLIGPIYP